MLRLAWLRGLAIGLGLMAGCIYQTTTGPIEEVRPPQPPTIVPPPVAVADARGAPESVRGANAAPEVPELPPLVRAKIEMGSAPLSPVLPPPEPAPVPDDPLVALLQSLRKKDKKAAKEVERLDASRREQLLALLKLTVGVNEGSIEKLSPEEAAALLAQLRHVCTDLCRRAPLQLRNVAYCRSVKGFGQFEPAGKDPEFQAGADGQPGERVQVYAEVCHFRSRANKSGHETKLDASLEVLDGNGKRVAKVPLGTCSDCSQSPRHDYFLNCQFHVPSGLKPGKYTLRLKVRDLAPGDGPRQARSSLELRVSAPHSS
jgi:hypothetical protein